MPVNKLSSEICQPPRIHASVTVSTKGQVIIPKEIRELVKIDAGDTLVVITKDDAFVGLIPTKNMDLFMQMMQKEIHAQ